MIDRRNFAKALAAALAAFCLSFTKLMATPDLQIKPFQWEFAPNGGSYWFSWTGWKPAQNSNLFVGQWMANPVKKYMDRLPDLYESVCIDKTNLARIMKKAFEKTPGVAMLGAFHALPLCDVSTLKMRDAEKRVRAWAKRAVEVAANTDTKGWSFLRWNTELKQHIQYKPHHVSAYEWGQRFHIPHDKSLVTSGDVDFSNLKLKPGEIKVIPKYGFTGFKKPDLSSVQMTANGNLYEAKLDSTGRIIGWYEVKPDVTKIKIAENPPGSDKPYRYVVDHFGKDCDKGPMNEDSLILLQKATS